MQYRIDIKMQHWILLKYELDYLLKAKKNFYVSYVYDIGDA